jgi:predicted metallo-beta-lactamase superfamily hydrolase
MSWNTFSVKQTPSLGAGASVIVTDAQFPFGNTTIYRSVNVWVTTTATQAQYVVTILLNDVIQDSITAGPSKTVANYQLDQILMKDPSLMFKVGITNNATQPITFVIIITGEYWS